MLKITRKNDNAEFITVKLCGRFTGEYVPEVENALSQAGTQVRKLALDLAEITLVDRTAIAFLCGARSRNIAIQNVPVYVGLWMDQEDCQGSHHLD